MSTLWLYTCFFWGLSAMAASCPLTKATNRDNLVLRGEVFPTSHDTFIRPVGCDERVIIVFGDSAELGELRIPVRRDQTLQHYEEYLLAEQEVEGATLCRECWKYRVIAEFQGRLDIRPAAGLQRDPASRKATGVEGFGHPVPFTRYRLVVMSVLRVEAVERVLK